MLFGVAVANGVVLLNTKIKKKHKKMLQKKAKRPKILC